MIARKPGHLSEQWRNNYNKKIIIMETFFVVLNVQL